MGKNTWLLVGLGVVVYLIWHQNQTSGQGLICAPGYVSFTNPTTGQTMCVLAPTT